jgi:hypothetical protein
MQRVLPVQSDRIVSDRLFWEVLLKDDRSQRLEEQAEKKLFYIKEYGLEGFF